MEPTEDQEGGLDLNFSAAASGWHCRRRPRCYWIYTGKEDHIRWHPRSSGENVDRRHTGANIFNRGVWIFSYLSWL